MRGGGSRRWWVLGTCALVAVLVAAGFSITGGKQSSAGAPPDAEVLVALPLEGDATAITSAATSRRFLPFGQLAPASGVEATTVDDAVHALGRLGVSVAADPTRAALWGRVSVATAERVFSVRFAVHDTDGTRTVRPVGTPKVPAGVPGVSAVVGLSATFPGDAGAAGVESGGSTSASPPCPDDAEAPPDLVDRFGDVAAASGAAGGGTTVAVLSVERYVPRVAALYGECTGAGTATVTDVTGARSFTPAEPGGPELALDTLVIGALAPEAAIHVTRFDAATSPVFPLLDVLEQAARDGRTPDVLAFTVGYCERSLQRPEVTLAERLLAALAAAGTTPVAATGDEGSSACHPSTDAPAVQYPASSAWVTAVGGSSFEGSSAVPAGLQVWNDSPREHQAGGGGVSERIERPPWQRALAVSGSGRAVPDLVAFADPSRFGQLPVCTTTSRCSWTHLGGTSLATAGLAGLVARSVTNRHERFGTLSSILAESGALGAVPTIDMTYGTNHVYTDSCCEATAGFDLASGWGLFDAARLAAAAGALDQAAGS